MSGIARPQPVQLDDSGSARSLRYGLRAAAWLFMLSIITLGVVSACCGDWFLGTVVVLTGLLGWRGFDTGAIRGVFGLASVLFVCAWAVPIGKILCASVRQFLFLPHVPGRYVSILLVALVILLLGQVAGRLAAWSYQRYFRRAGRTAHTVGMLVGMAEGCCLALTMLLALVAIEPPVRMTLALASEDKPWAQPAYSQVLKLKEQTHQTLLAGPLASVYQSEHEVLELGGMLALASRYPGTITALNRSERMRRLQAEESAIKRLKREIKLDRPLKLAIKRGDLAVILNSPTVIRMLEDQHLAEVVKARRYEIMDAIWEAIPMNYRPHAQREFARLQGLSVSELRAAAVHRLDQLRDGIADDQQGTFDEVLREAGAKSTGRLLGLLDSTTSEPPPGPAPDAGPQSD